MKKCSAGIKILILTLVAMNFFLLTTNGQPKTIHSYKNGIYENLWRYKNDKLQNKAYIKIVFLNDSIFLYTISDNRKKITFNTTTLSGSSYIGRKILYKGEKKWFIIRDDANTGYSISPDEFTDTTDRMDFMNAINFDWKHSKYNLTPEPSKNPYEIYEVQFHKDSFYVHSFRTFEPDNGDIGMHYKIDDATGNYFSLDSMDISNICENCFFPAKIKTDCISKFIPIPENIPGNSIAYNFKPNERVLVSKNTYLKYAFVITLDSLHKEKKYGWILRSYLTTQ